MKNYEKSYENVFTSERTLKKCNLKRISISDNESLDNYILNVRNTTHSFYDNIFDSLVKLSWLYRRFCYNGKRRDKPMANGFMIDGSFGVFYRHYIGVDNQFISGSEMFAKIIGYFDDFFPDFNNNNPFENKYEFPYKFITLEYLIVVYQMEERLELLKYADDNKMRYTEFLDYIVNYINCYNEEHGNKYEFVMTKWFMMYVKVHKKYEESRKQTKKKT